MRCLFVRSSEHLSLIFTKFNILLESHVANYEDFSILLNEGVYFASQLLLVTSHYLLVTSH